MATIAIATPPLTPQLPTYAAFFHYYAFQDRCYAFAATMFSPAACRHAIEICCCHAVCRHAPRAKIAPPRACAARFAYYDIDSFAAADIRVY